jgi:hypothetical protein
MMKITVACAAAVWVGISWFIGTIVAAVVTRMASARCGGFVDSANTEWTLADTSEVPAFHAARISNEILSRILSSS